jgi:hypothetical protein
MLKAVVVVLALVVAAWMIGGYLRNLRGRPR